jgi:choline-sulfatase
VRLTVIALLTLSLACARQETQAPPPIILISIDTLRSDRLPMYGYDGVATPALDALRNDSVLFRNAWSHSPLTLPSHATMLSGVLPAVHGARDNTGFRVSPDVASVAAVLRGNGYETGAAVSAFVLRRSTGINAGFDGYDDALGNARDEKSLGHIQRAGDDTVAVAQRWIAARDGAKPFFYFLHLYEPHAPYTPPEPYASRYAAPYDGEIAATDAILGRFLTFLKAEGIYDRAMIVVVSDHGEGLGDHGEDEHGIFLYREAIAVPMLVKLPRQELAGSDSEVAVGLFDVAPTMLRVANVEPPAEMQGRAMFDGARLAALPERAIYSETWYPRFHFGWSELHSLVERGEHLIDAPRAELYDLARDPGEKVNVIDERRRRYVAMRETLGSFKQAAEAPSAISSEEREKLAALGYIGSGSSAGDGPRADPKDKIGIFRELQAAFRLSREGKEEAALAAFDGLLAREPEMVDLWDVRAKTLFRLGRTKDGIASAKEALRRNPSATHLAADLANALLLDGQLEDARKHAELAMRSDPVKAHSILARVHLASGDLAAAEAAAKEAIAAGGDVNAAVHTLASVQHRRGDFAGALATSQQLTVEPLPRGVWSLRGDALARLGRSREAEAAFRRELTAFPDHTEAAGRLVLLLVSENRDAEATDVIRNLAAASPDRRTFDAIAETLRIVGDEDGVRYWSARARSAS